MVKDNLTTAITDIAQQPVVIYPNPCNSLFYVKGLQSTNEKIMVSVSSELGQELIRKELNGNNPIDISALPAGLYLVQIQQGDSNYFQKIIKTKN